MKSTGEKRGHETKRTRPGCSRRGAAAHGGQGGEPRSKRAQVTRIKRGTAEVPRQEAQKTEGRQKKTQGKGREKLPGGGTRTGSELDGRGEGRRRREVNGCMTHLAGRQTLRKQQKSKRRRTRNN